MPSKAPSATTEGDSSGGKDGRPRMIRIEQTFRTDRGAARPPDSEQGTLGVVHAHGPCRPSRRRRRRLTVAEGAALLRIEPDRRQRYQSGVEWQQPVPEA